jgi:hypothetical protein
MKHVGRNVFHLPNFGKKFARGCCTMKMEKTVLKEEHEVQVQIHSRRLWNENWNNVGFAK